MTDLLKMAAISLTAVLLLDFAWFGVMQSFYAAHMEGIGRIVGGKFQPHYWSAAIVYLLIAAGMTIFVMPGITIGTPTFFVFLKGAFFGLCLYGVYGFTNFAILRYSLPVSVVDTLWGTLVVGLAAVITRYFSMIRG